MNYCGDNTIFYMQCHFQFRLLINNVINYCICLSVITGSSEGIGKAYARELAKRGVNVILVSRGENRLRKAAKEIGNVIQIYLDFTCNMSKTTV